MEKPKIDKIRIVKEIDEISTSYSKNEIEIVIRTEAEVSYSIGNENRRIEFFSSGGLWGIKLDSNDEYIQKIILEELNNLKSHLQRFEINVSNFRKLSHKAINEFNL